MSRAAVLGIAIGWLAMMVGAHASDGVINFAGSVTSSTCIVHAGSTNQTVRMPALSVTMLTGSALRSATGDELASSRSAEFQISISGCDPAAARAAPFFQSFASTVTATGRLRNAAKNSPARGVEIEIVNAAGVVVDLSRTASLQMPRLTATRGLPASARFSARYAASDEATVTAGQVASSATYSMVYE